MSRVDLVEIGKLREAGYISSQKHPTLDLFIHNYTHKTQWERNWNEWTILCRGLITDPYGNIVSRSLSKFHNVEEHSAVDPLSNGYKLPAINWNQPFICTGKVDGSLIVQYHHGNEMGLASRGSFTSDHSRWAMEIWKKRGYRDAALIGHTMVFELIHPQNRIVVDYGQREELILLDVIKNETGMGIPYDGIQQFAEEIGCECIKKIVINGDVDTALKEYQSKQTQEEEGLVIRFDDGMRVKVKLSEYCRLHKLLTGINSRMIWESLRDGKSLDPFLERVPDEFMEWLKNEIQQLNQSYGHMFHWATTEYANIKTCLGNSPSRKDYALRFTPYGHLSSILFQLLDGKDPSQTIWKLIKPEASKPFRCGEDV